MQYSLDTPLITAEGLHYSSTRIHLFILNPSSWRAEAKYPIWIGVAHQKAAENYNFSTTNWWGWSSVINSKHYLFSYQVQKTVFVSMLPEKHKNKKNNSLISVHHAPCCCINWSKRPNFTLEESSKDVFCDDFVTLKLWEMGLRLKKFLL